MKEAKAGLLAFLGYKYLFEVVIAI